MTILLCFGQSRPCQSKLEDSTAQLKEKGNVDNFLILLQNQRILTAFLALIQASSWLHNLMGKEMCGIFWWLMVCFSSFPWVCKMDVVYISGKNAIQCWKHCSGDKNAVCKLEIHSGCVHLQNIQHALSILNLGFISSVEHMIQLKQISVFAVVCSGQWWLNQEKAEW